jgi:hypothetical protein
MCDIWPDFFTDEYQLNFPGTCNKNMTGMSLSQVISERYSASSFFLYSVMLHSMSYTVSCYFIKNILEF